LFHIRAARGKVHWAGALWCGRDTAWMTARVAVAEI
jgi:hypothetical protein